MEGIIPYVYRAIVQYRTRGQVALGASSWFNESPSNSYVRLPGGSPSEIQLFRSDHAFTSTSSSMSTSSSCQLITSASSQSPVLRSTARRLV